MRLFATYEFWLAIIILSISDNNTNLEDDSDSWKFLVIRNEDPVSLHTSRNKHKRESLHELINGPDV